MCRGKNHGDRRCPHDTSEARKRRRRAAQGRELYNQPIFLNPDDQKVMNDDIAPRPFSELKKEAQLIGALLHAPIDKDPAVQAEIDAKNELLVTRLGIELANEADRRAKFNPKSFDRKYQKMSKSFLAVSEELTPVRSLYSESRALLMQAEGKGWPRQKNFVPNEEEVARLEKIHQEHEEKYKEVQKRWDEEDRRDDERRKALVQNTMARLTKEYKSIIAEIRPVGGEFNNHELSSEDGRKTFQETVGKDYPSAWIKASNEAGPMVIVTNDERPSYNISKTFEGDDAKGMKQNMEHTSLIGEEDKVREKIRLLSEDGDKITVKGSPFNIQGHDSTPILVARFPSRIPLDPTKDSTDSTGKPVGEGWKYGHVLNDKFEVDGTKQWYRQQGTGSGEIPAITISHSSHPDAKSYAYHEAIHRFEHTLGNGAMTRAETAFLNRRASVNGKPKPLIGISPSNDILGSEVAAEGGFIQIYAGRVYPDQQSKEIMSVGTEALFSGKHGGFLNIEKGNREDKDHRGFVLGMFATV